MLGAPPMQKYTLSAERGSPDEPRIHEVPDFSALSPSTIFMGKRIFSNSGLLEPKNLNNLPSMDLRFRKFALSAEPLLED